MAWLYSRFALIICAAFLVDPAPVKSQENHHEILNWFGTFTEAQVAKIRNIIRGNMSERERNIERTVEFRVIRSDLNNARAFTELETGQRVVEIHVGIVRATEMIATARAYSVLTGDTQITGDWLAYVAESIDQRINNPIEARNMSNIESFVSYIGMDEAARNKFMAEPRAHQYLELEMNSSLMWLVSHELGHHFANHRRPATLQKSRQQEEEADAIARRLMRGTGYNPVFATPMLLTFALWEPEAHFRESSRTHPAPLTRIEKNLREGYRYFRQDPSFNNYLERQGLAESFYDGLESDLEALRMLRLPEWHID